MKPTGSIIAGALVTVVAAFAISVSNISLPAVYANGGDVQAFLTGRYAFGFLAAAALALASRLRASLTDRSHVPLSQPEAGAALLSGSIYGAGALLVLGSIVLIPVNLAILILFTFPVITVLIQSIVDRRAPRVLQLALMISALGGVAIALDIGKGNLNLLGLVMAAGGAVLVATSFVMNERLLPNTNPFAAAGFMSLAGLAVVVGFALATGSFSLPAAGTGGMMALFVAIGFSTIAFITMFWAVHASGATPTAMVMNLEPVFTIAMSFWILNEAVSLQRLTGAAIVIGSVVLSQWVAVPRNRQNRAGTHIPPSPGPAPQIHPRVRVSSHPQPLRR